LSAYIMVMIRGLRYRPADGGDIVLSKGVSDLKYLHTIKRNLISKCGIKSCLRIVETL